MIIGPVKEEYYNQKMLGKKYTPDSDYSELDIFLNSPEEFRKIREKIEKSADADKNLIAYLNWREYMADSFQKLYRDVNDRKEQAKLPPVENNGGRIEIPSVHLRTPQTSHYGCWSVSMSLLLEAKGVKMSQEAIRAYCPTLDLETLRKKNASDDIYYAVVTENFGKDSMTNPFYRSELVTKVLPNTASRQFEVKIDSKIVDDKSAYENTKTQLLEKIKGILVNTHSPICMNVGGHYVTIFGVENDRLMVKDSDRTEANLSDATKYYDLNTVIENFKKTGQNGTVSYGIIDFMYLENVENNTLRDVEGLSYGPDGKLEINEEYKEAEEKREQELGYNPNLFTDEAVTVSFDTKMNSFVTITEKICPPTKLTPMKEVPYSGQLYEIPEYVSVTAASQKADGQQEPEKKVSEEKKPEVTKTEEKKPEAELREPEIIDEDEEYDFEECYERIRKNVDRQMKDFNPNCNESRAALAKILREEYPKMRQLAEQLETIQGFFTVQKQEYSNLKAQMHRFVQTLEDVQKNVEAPCEETDYTAMLLKVRREMRKVRKAVSAYQDHVKKNPKRGKIRRERRRQVFNLDNSLTKMEKLCPLPGRSLSEQATISLAAKQIRERFREELPYVSLSGDPDELKANLEQSVNDFMKFFEERMDRESLQDGMRDEDFWDYRRGEFCPIASFVTCELLKKNDLFRQIPEYELIRIVGRSSVVSREWTFVNESLEEAVEFAQNGAARIADAAEADVRRKVEEYIRENQRDEAERELTRQKKLESMASAIEAVNGVKSAFESDQMKLNASLKKDDFLQKLNNMALDKCRNILERLVSGDTERQYPEDSGISDLIPMLVFRDILKRESMAGSNGKFTAYLRKQPIEEMLNRIREIDVVEKACRKADESFDDASRLIRNNGKVICNGFWNQVRYVAEHKKEVREKLAYKVLDILAEQSLYTGAEVEKEGFVISSLHTMEKEMYDYGRESIYRAMMKKGDFTERLDNLCKDYQPLMSKEEFMKSFFGTTNQKDIRPLVDEFKATVRDEFYKDYRSL